jgi:hypothetical protein
MQGSLGRKLAWFVALWAASVALLAVVAFRPLVHG